MATKQQANTQGCPLPWEACLLLLLGERPTGPSSPEGLSRPTLSALLRKLTTVGSLTKQHPEQRRQTTQSIPLGALAVRLGGLVLTQCSERLPAPFLSQCPGCGLHPGRGCSRQRGRIRNVSGYCREELNGN